MKFVITRTNPMDIVGSCHIQCAVSNLCRCSHLVDGSISKLLMFMSFSKVKYTELN